MATRLCGYAVVMASASLNTAIICCIRPLFLDELQDVYIMTQRDEGSTHDSA